MRAQLAATLRIWKESIHQWARIRPTQWNRHMYQCVRYGRDEARENDSREQG